MKALTLLLALFFLPIILHAQDQQKLLEHAYKTHSKKELKLFFDNWHKEIPPISDSEFVKLTDLQKETYRVFEAFYHPDNLSVLTRKDEESNVYKDAAFLILEPSIKIEYPDKIWLSYNDSDSAIVQNIVMSVQNDSARNSLLRRQINGRLSDRVLDIYGFPFVINQLVNQDSIVNFRPQIDNSDRMPLYLTSQYKNILDKFLAKGNLGEKMDFLGEFAKLNRPNLKLGRSYGLTSIPIVRYITFDDSIKRARLYFAFNGNAGVVILKKENTVWKIVGSKWHWVY